MAETKFDNIKNRLPLVMIVFVLSYLLSALTDRKYIEWLLSDGLSLIDYFIDFAVTLLMSFVFVELSVFYSSWSFRHVSFANNPYRGVLVHALLLMLFNNLTAWCFPMLMNLFFDNGIAFFNQQLYMSSVIATFVSYIYTNAHYMESSILAERQKKELEITLLKEKERAAQMQLEVLKSQIDPHFMFNNFSILSELIVENGTLAGKFLDNLSRVYRYVIQNLKQDMVPIAEEVAFLRSYICLIKMRYEDAVNIEIDEGLEQTDGQIPPICLQLLVENAIKHNRISVRQPLLIRIFREGNRIVVENDLRSVVSDLRSTGIGHKNIIGRYYLLRKEKPFIEKRESTYIVKLPIIRNKYEHTDY